MLPVDHLLLTESQALPALVVVRLPTGMTHFLVIWGRFGNYLQIMDPATGRRWPSWKRFQEELYIHTFPVSAQAWHDWAGTDGFLAPAAMNDLGPQGLATADQFCYPGPGRALYF
jgi:ATP-binding cassette subfamily B protein